MATIAGIQRKKAFEQVSPPFALNYTGKTANWNLLFARFSVQHLITYLIFMLKICIEDRAAAYCLFLGMKLHTPAAPRDGCGQLYSFCHKFFHTFRYNNRHSVSGSVQIIFWFIYVVYRGNSKRCFHRMQMNAQTRNSH